MQEHQSGRVQVQSLYSRGLLGEADRILSAKVAARGGNLQDVLDWVRSAALRGDFHEAVRRLKDARSRFKTVNWTPLEVEVLTTGRDYQKASALIASALLTVRDPKDAVMLKELKFESDLMKSISARIASVERRGAEVDLAVYAINLDENVDRWERVSALARPHVLRRIAGVPGRYLADGLVARFGPQVSPKFKGTLGCFLAHYAAWERHLKSADQYALILEDDCLPLINIPRNSAALMLPDDFDICFLTTGLGKVDRQESSVEQLPVYRAVAESVAKLAPRLVAPGGYAYVLSRRGAERLIARVDEDGFFGDVDWRMVAYCLTRQVVEDYPSESFAYGALNAHFRVVRSRVPLIGFACHPGLVRPGRLGSVRERDNEAPHAHLLLQQETGE